ICRALRRLGRRSEQGSLCCHDRTFRTSARLCRKRVRTGRIVRPAAHSALSFPEKVRDPGDFTVTIKIYGPTASRAARALWIGHELDIPFEHVAMEMKDLKGAEYLKINPNGKVPALVDGDFKLFESMAINLYLAAKHGKDGFFPASLEDQALCQQWSFWGMTEIEKPLLPVLIDKFMTAPDKRKPEAAA